MSDDIGDDVAGDGEQEEQANVSDAGQEGEEDEQAGDGDGAGEGEEEEEEGDDVQVTDSSEVGGLFSSLAFGQLCVHALGRPGPIIALPRCPRPAPCLHLCWLAR